MADAKKKYRVVLTSISNYEKSFPEGSEIELTDKEREGLERFTVPVAEGKPNAGGAKDDKRGNK